ALFGLVERAKGCGWQGLCFCGDVDDRGAAGRPAGKVSDVRHKHHDIQDENNRPDEEDQNSPEKLDHRKSRRSGSILAVQWSPWASIRFKAIMDHAIRHSGMGLLAQARNPGLELRAPRNDERSESIPHPA